MRRTEDVASPFVLEALGERRGGNRIAEGGGRGEVHADELSPFSLSEEVADELGEAPTASDIPQEFAKPQYTGALKAVDVTKRVQVVAGAAGGYRTHNQQLTPGASRVKRVVVHVLVSNFGHVLKSWHAGASKNPTHYVISKRGTIAQVVAERLVAFHANSANTDSIGIEHDGYYKSPAFFTEEMLRASAKLVADICGRHGLSIDRQHIVGHDEVWDSCHGDPGGFWDWDYYLSLVRLEAGQAKIPPLRKILTSESITPPSVWDVRQRGTVANGPNKSKSWGGTYWAAKSTPGKVPAGSIGGDDVARFAFVATTPGWYDVSLWFPIHRSNCPSVPVRVFVNDEAVPRISRVIDQTKANVRRTCALGSTPTWQSQGAVWALANQKVVVEILRQSVAPGLVVADAVRLLCTDRVKVTGLVPEQPTVECMSRLEDLCCCRTKNPEARARCLEKKKLGASDCASLRKLAAQGPSKRPGTTADRELTARGLDAEELAFRQEIERDIQAESASDEVNLEGPAPTVAGKPAGERDPLVAVPVFSVAERGRVPGPLLSAEKNARAAKANADLHPAKSGITPEELRAACRVYVDLDAIDRAIKAHNQAGRGTPIGPGTLAFDAILVEAIHVFQQKCYFRPKLADGLAGETTEGVAGESTLDSLGLIRHKLKPRTDPTFKGALEVLRRHATAVEKATAGEFTVGRWYQDFVNPSFLGHRFKVAVHPMLMRSLRKAETHLLAQPSYAGLTPVSLGRTLGFTPEREVHAGGRPNPNLKGSFHGFGLAIDIRYARNPWVAGNPGQKKYGNPQFVTVMSRATLVMRGQSVEVTPKYLSGLSSQKTAAIWNELRGLSDTLRSYLKCANDESALRKQLEIHRNAKGILEQGESLDQAVRRWKERITRDAESLDHKGNFKGRDGREGFFDLPLDLVVALRDHAGMKWGAVDIGENQSGDIMHFDVRGTPLGRAVRGASPHKASRPPTKSPVRGALVDPPGETLYAEIPVQSGAKTSKVGIFLPEKFRANNEVDLVFYFHGLLGPCESPGPDVDCYWDMGLAKPGQRRGKGPVPLREVLNASAKNAILVVPSLGPSANVGKLAKAGGFDTLVNSVLTALQTRSKVQVKPTGVRNIVLAGHSGGGKGLRGIVVAGDAKAGLIREVWGFESFYSDSDPNVWKAWASAEPDRTKRRVLHYHLKNYLKDQKTKAAPWRHSDELSGLVKAAGLNNVDLVHVTGENHCTVPLAFFQKRLEAAAALDKV